MDYKRGDMVYFQFHPEYYEDETWYPGTILRHSDVSKCYEITVKGQWRHFFAPPERLKIREENVDEETKRTTAIQILLYSHLGN